ncbi:sensor histidine kinase [Ramlibacter albus]|uniref:histidine kinase n=1 Tax=Ramlibacter albus TaxID=2079448 RepID=A0A923MAI0_9BURK|nr:ATP-binding protein [Ramlibacter albus]MBC5767277.1 PAS domain S-box protein [Ramlibacter albus]
MVPAVSHQRQMQIVARLCAVGAWTLHLGPLRFEPSDEWLALHGCKPGARPSTHAVMRLMDPPDRSELAARLRRCAREGVAFEMVVGTRTFDGRHAFMRLIAEPCEEQAGRVTCLQGACQDVTALMERERELDVHRLRLEDLVEQRTRDLRAFSYALAHDLRAPINAMASFSQVLAERLPADAPARMQHYAQRIVANGQRAEALIAGILELIGTAQVPIDKQPVDLTAVAWQSIYHLRAREPDRDVDVDVQPGLHARADARLVVSVMENLLRNAWKFSVRSRPARIRVGRDADGAFFVSDNGIGFDAAHAQRLFEPLQRLPGSEEFAGTGVGLAAASSIVRRHGGRMWAEAEPGVGATFRFTLPDD